MGEYDLYKSLFIKELLYLVEIPLKNNSRQTVSLVRFTTEKFVVKIISCEKGESGCPVLNPLAFDDKITSAVNGVQNYDTRRYSMSTASNESRKAEKTLIDIIAKLFTVSEEYAAGYFMMNGSYYRPCSK